MRLPTFQTRWLTRFGLVKTGWRKSVRTELATRPFADTDIDFVPPF